MRRLMEKPSDDSNLPLCIKKHYVHPHGSLLDTRVVDATEKAVTDTMVFQDGIAITEP